MNVVTLVDFHDNVKNVDRKRGEQFVVSRERYDEVNAVGIDAIGAPILEEVTREAAAQNGKQTPESRRRKRKA